MDDPEINDMVMRAFLLGVQVVYRDRGEEYDLNALGPHLRLLAEIADGSATLQDPGEMAAKCPKIAEQILRAGQIVIGAERKLATRVREGFRDMVR